ncbi:GerAB/ArcD/ProY family transporter [Paenibacillus piri]|uniref:Spore gernimation protein n=1 Tax=Paenibacillus piri TaxID=2547395 RepID=A0A4R5KXN0_9BACL|nr:endospore germination permease [Paenibacillus piri]TDG00804.1 spore gernimation protein [Paenibacillus piri]
MKNTTFSFLQISTILILSIGMMNHVIIIPVLLEVSGRDSWLSVLATSVIFVPVFLIIAYIIQKTTAGGGSSILQWLKEKYGRWVAGIITFVMSVSLFFSAVLTGKDFKTWTNASYLPQTPPSVIAIILVALACYMSYKGIRAIAYASAVLLPLVIIFGEFVMVANYPHKDYSMLFPMFEFGTKFLTNGIIFVGTGLIEVMYLIFLQQHIATPIRKWYVLMLGLFLAGLTLGPTMGSIAAFGPVEAQIQRYPAFEEWRLVKIGNYIEHVDFLSIYQWVCGAFVRISLAIFLIAETLPKYKKLVLFIIAVVMLVLLIYEVGDINFLLIMKKYYFPINFCLMSGLLLTVFLLVLCAGKDKVQKPNES